MNQYKDRYCHISYNSSMNQVYLKWLMPPDEKALLYSYSKGIDMAIWNQADSWVTDNSIGFQTDMSMQHALTQLIVSRIEYTTLKRFARITPIDVFQELITHKVLGQINAKTLKCLEFEIFHDPKEAQAWCSQLKQVATC